MKIALVNQTEFYSPNDARSIPSGVIVYTRGLAKALSARGHEVTVLAKRVDSQKEVPDEYDYEGFKVVLLPWCESLFEFSEYVHAWLTVHPQDVVEAHQYEHPLFIEQLIGGTPTVTRHCSDFLDSLSGGRCTFKRMRPTFKGGTCRQEEWSRHLAEMHTIQGADLVLCAGQKQLQKAMQVGAKASVELPLGIESVVKEDHVQPGNIVLIGVGRMRDARKGGELVPAILGHIPKEFRVVVLGETETDDELKGYLAQAPREAEWVTNPVPEAQLLKLYDESIAVILPTKSESFGLMFLEALSRGKPVVCFDQPDKSKDQWPLWRLGPLGDPKSLANLVPALNRAKDISPAETAGFLKFASNFKWSELVRAYEELYSRAIALSLVNKRLRSW